jgi:photosystem II stability/assembly factor-like uncharacterized protein
MKRIGLILMAHVLMAIPVFSQEYNLDVDVDTVMSLDKVILCHSIYAPNDSAVWADFASEIYRSLDGGYSWERISVPYSATWSSLRPLNTDTAFYSAMYAGFYKTTDGGETWEDMHKAENHPNHFHFFDHADGIIVEDSIYPPGNPHEDHDLRIWKTSDGGYTWTRVLEPDRPAFLPDEGIMHHANNMNRQTIGDTIFFGTSMGRVFRSFDRGNTWEAFYTGLGENQFIISIAHHGTKNMMVLSDGEKWGPDFKTSFTNDGGESWITYSADWGSGSIAAMPGVESSFLLLKGVYDQHKGLFITDDGGETYSIISELSDIPGRTLTFVNDSTAIMPTNYESQLGGPDSDYILRITFRYEEDHNSIEENNSGKVRIYPNPADEILTIETNTPGQHSVEISSINGLLLYSKDMEGTTRQIDLSSFQKGIYIITISSEDFVTSRKIIKL